MALIAEQQQQWTQAGEYFLHAMQAYVEYSEQHNLDILLTDFARLHRASGDTTLPAAVAAILRIPPAEAAALLAQAAGDADC